MAQTTLDTRIRKPSKFEVTEPGPWTLYWRLPQLESTWQPVPDLFPEWIQMLEAVRSKVRELRAEGLPMRLSYFYAHSANGMASQVLSFLHDWDDQFQSTCSPAGKVPTHMMSGDLTYLHEIFTELEILFALGSA